MAPRIFQISRAPLKAHDIMRDDARDFPSPPLFDPLRFARLRGDSARADRSGNSEDGLLRENEGAIRKPRMRSARSETGSGPAMLRRLRFRSRWYPDKRDAVRLSVNGRRKLFRLRFVRTFSFATASGSTAARLIRFANRVGSSCVCGTRLEGNSTGGFHEISICDHSGPGADRHSERDFELG